MGQVLLKLLVGAGAGLLAWALTEPQYGTSDQSELRMVLVAGALIGLAIGGLNGLTEGSRRRAGIGAGLGALFGVIGISLGYSIGTGVSMAVFQVPPHLVQGPGQILARALALAPVGLGLGAAIGASTLNRKRLLQGVTGGLIAGLATGFGFDLVGQLVAQPQLAIQGQTQGDVGQIPRALTWTLLGGTIGLFIGIVERVSRQAWIRQPLGRNEGKEWAIYGPNTVIGRSEGAQIPIFSDPTIAPQHALIQYHQGQYYLSDLSGVGTFLNGHPVSQTLLPPGSEIRIGGTLLHFLVKNAPAPAPAPMYAPMPTQTPYVPPTPTQMPQPMPGGSQPTVAFPSPPMTGGAPTVAYANPVLTLVAMDGPLLGQRFPIASPTEVGRETGPIPLGFDTAASRRHAALAPTPAGLQVTDLASTNGVLVAGQRVGQALVPVGQTVKIGSTTFRVEA